MRRRAFVAGLAGLLAARRPGFAQAGPGERKIGFLHPRTVHPDSPTVSLLRPAWNSLGYTEDDTVILRSASGDLHRLPQLAVELSDLGVDVLIAVGPAAVRAASTATNLPIVGIDLETDPVRTGLAASFSRPGGRVTGLFLDQSSLAGKWVDLLREAIPSLERIALMWDSTTTSDQLEAAREAARTRGLDSPVLGARTADEYDRLFGGLGGGDRTAVLQLGSPGFIVAAPGFAESAIRHGLATIAFLKVYARAGVLMTYGPNQEVFWPRAVVLADRIAKGETPGDLPIERPDRFEFVINLRTAKALGRQLAASLLIQADEVIE